MAEFTGERVVPGQVDPDLWNEHRSRYLFAQRYAQGRRVVDLGCGTGYGSAILGDVAREVIGIDIAPEAIAFARERFRTPRSLVRFQEASATSTGLPEQSCEVVVAFEVIEHLADWRDLLTEARRLLTPEGVLLVSTPNRLYYAEARGESGPNPFHVHEFDYDEFQRELEAHFAHVVLYTQNHAAALAFSPPIQQCAGDGHIAPAGDGREAHYFLAVCGQLPESQPRPFAFVPEAANVLRERERHIAKLTGSLAQVQADHVHLLELHRTVQAELDERHRWVSEVEQKLAEAKERVLNLQNEVAAAHEGYSAQLRTLDKELATTREAYAAQLQQREEELTTARQRFEETRAELTTKGEELVRTVELLDRAEATVVERTAWAQGLEREKQQLQATLDVVRSSRWVKLGRTLSVGPEVG